MKVREGSKGGGETARSEPAKPGALPPLAESRLSVSSIVLRPHLESGLDKILGEWLVPAGVLAKPVHQVNHTLWCTGTPAIEKRRDAITVDKRIVNALRRPRH